MYLMEEGLELWAEGTAPLSTLEATALTLLLLPTVMQAAPGLDPRLLAMYPNITVVLERSFEAIEECLKLIELYIIVGGAEFLAAHQQALVTTLLHIIGNVQDHSTTLTLTLIELLVQRFTDAAFLQPVFAKILSVMQKDMAEKNLQPTMLVAYLHCFARLLLTAPQLFSSFFTNVIRASPLPLFDMMLDNVSNSLLCNSSSDCFPSDRLCCRASASQTDCTGAV